MPAPAAGKHQVWGIRRQVGGRGGAHGRFGCSAPRSARRLAAAQAAGGAPGRLAAAAALGRLRPPLLYRTTESKPPRRVNQPRRRSVTGLSYILQLAAGKLLQLRVAPLLPVPVPLVIASLVPFALDVPATSSFSFLGLACSEKAFVYLSGLQLVLALGRKGLAAAGLCLLAGGLQRANFLGLRRLQVRGACGHAIGNCEKAGEGWWPGRCRGGQPACAEGALCVCMHDFPLLTMLWLPLSASLPVPQLPRALVRAVAQAFGPLLGDGHTGPVVLLPGAAARHPGGGPPGLGPARGDGGGGARGGRRAPVRAGPPPEPSPEALEQLLSMGFDRARATAALQRTHNDVQAAIAQLVG